MKSTSVMDFFSKLDKKNARKVYIWEKKLKNIQFFSQYTHSTALNVFGSAEVCQCMNLNCTKSLGMPYS